MTEESQQGLNEINRAVAVILGQVADIIKALEEIKKEATTLYMQNEDKLNGE